MDDLISRQAAIEAVNTALFPKINTAKDAEKALSALPSAQPERKRGKWLHTDDMYEVPFCSKCRWEDNDYNEFKFCPNCGAEMEQ